MRLMSGHIGSCNESNRGTLIVSWQQLPILQDLILYGTLAGYYVPRMRILRTPE